MNHTKEPWKTGRGDCHTIYGPKIAGHEQKVAICPTQDGERDYPSVQVFFNAQRIAACVNACAGIPTEALNNGIITNAMSALTLIVADLPTRRDWLDPDVEKSARNILIEPKGGSL
jgi:hypothetical protein